MTKISRLLIPIAVSALAIGLTGCSSRSIKSESLMDTPAYHVNQGLKLLDRNDLSGARDSFERARGLDKDYAEAWSGLALVDAAEGKFDEARDLADRGVGKASKNPWTYVVRGRVKTQERKGDYWINRADEDFEKAVKLNPKMSEAYYWWGIAHKNAFDFDRASSLFTQVIEYKDDWSVKADKEFAVVQKIVRAAPGTMIGKKIALVDEISRADLAVLFMEELKLADLITKERPKEYDTGYKAPDDPTMIKKAATTEAGDAVDISSHWAKSWIHDVTSLGIMEIGPDGKFYPDEKISRAEFALFIQNIMIAVLHDESIATKYIGEQTRFKDMKSGTATYNAAALCIDRGILQANLDGTFHPMESVSGADALLTIRQFQNQLRRTF